MKFSTVLFSIAILLVLATALTFAQTGYGIRIGNSASSGGSWDDSGNPAVWTSTTSYSYPFHTLNKDEIVSRLNAGTSVTIVTGAANGEIVDSSAISIFKTSGADATLRFQSNTSVAFNTSDSIVSTAGKLTVVMNGDADSTVNDGYFNVQNGASLYIASNDGDIVIGGGSDPYNSAITGYQYSAAVQGYNTKLLAGTGLISIRGLGTNGYAGVYVVGSSAMQTTSGNITLVGIGGNATYNSGYGVYLSNGPVIQTEDGAIDITATAGNASNSSPAGGMLMSQNGTHITSTNNGSITINATGGSSPYNGAKGLYMYVGSGAAPVIQTVNGNISITATAGSGSSNSGEDGVRIEGCNISATGTGSISIAGTGSGGTYAGHGVYHSSSLFQTASGSLTVTGTSGAGTTGGGYGVWLTANGGPTYGIVSASGLTTVTGTATNSGNGIFLQGSTTKIQSGGNIVVTGTVSGTGTGKGIQCSSDPGIYATGLGSITVNATGGSTGSNNQGLYLSTSSGGSRIQSEGGDITINATGGGSGTGGSNDGIYLQGATRIYSSGPGRVEVRGQGGNTGPGITIYNYPTDVFIGSDSGKVILSGFGGGSNQLGISKVFSAYGTVYIVAPDSVSLTGVGTGTGTGLYFGSGFAYIGSGNGVTHTGATVISGKSGTGPGLNFYNCTLAGLGALTFFPYNASDGIGVVTGQSGAMNIDNDALTAIQSGFSSITFGRSDGTGTINVGTYTFGTAVNLLSGSGTINVNGALGVGSNMLTIQTNGTLAGAGQLTGASAFLNGSGSSYSFKGTIDYLDLHVPGATLTGNTAVNNELHIYDTHLSTGAYTLTLGTSTSNYGFYYRDSALISGTFKRWIAGGPIDGANLGDPRALRTASDLVSTEFPMASSTFTNKSVYINLAASIPFGRSPGSLVTSSARGGLMKTSSLTGGTLTVSYTGSDPGTTGLPVADDTVQVARMDPTGYWSVTPGDGFALDGDTYDVDLVNDSVSYNNISKLHVLTQTGSGIPWIADGTHGAATGTSPNVTLHRTGKSAFGRFAVGLISGNATTMEYISGTDQIGSANSTLTSPFVVKVTDADGDPVLGEPVTFAVVDSPAYATGGSLSTYDAVTNASGLASATLTWANRAGHYKVTATSGSLTGSPVEFVARAFDQTAGKALFFDGSDDYVLSSTTLGNFGTGSFTIEAWVKTTATTGQLIVGKRDAPSHGSFFTFGISNTGKMTAELDEDGAGTHYLGLTGFTSVNDGNWHRVALVRNGALVTMFLDGRADVATGSVAAANISNTAPLSIGAQGIGGGDYSAFFSGSIDEVRIWNVARTTAELQADIHAPISSYPANLLAYWQFTEGTGSGVAIDAAGGNIGTLTNMNLSTTWSTSTIPFGGGTTNSQNLFYTGTANLGSLSITTTENLDNTMTIASRKYSVAPLNVPSGDLLADTYWSVDAYGNPGSFAVNTTFTVPSSFTGSNAKFPSQYKLYSRPFGSDGSWTLLNSVANATSSTTVTFNGVSQFGQFALATTSVLTDSTPGYALKFDGVDDNVSIPNSSSLQLTNNFTIETWAKLDQLPSVGTSAVLYTKGQFPNFGYGLRVTNTGAVTYTSYNVQDYSSPDSVFSAGPWHHVAATLNSSNNVSLYVDGNLVATVAGTVGPAVINSEIARMGYYSGTGWYFKGQLDEMRIWNTALDSTTIRANMHRTITGNTANLVAEWQYVEGSGATVSDPVGGNNGTLIGFNFDSTSGWASSTIPVGPATVTSNNAFTTGTAALGTVSVTTTDDFDNAVVLVGSSIPLAPNVQPTGSAAVLSDRYWVVDKYNDGGTFSTNVTFTVPSTFAGSSVPDGFYKLYARDGNGDGAWELVKTGASSSTSTTVTFSGITEFGQFALGKIANSYAASGGGGNVWSTSNGTLTFTRPNNVDQTQAVYQDRLTENVWITRANTQGVYNIKSEGSYSHYYSPAGTEWGFGTTANLGSISFNNWEVAVGYSPPAMVNQNMVVHLIADDIYVDLKFTSWTQGPGGGFSYIRGVGQPVKSLAPTNVTDVSATLVGSVALTDSALTVYILYGTTSGIYTDSVAVDQNPVLAGGTTVVTADVAGLEPGTVYYTRTAVSSETTYERSSEASFRTVSHVAGYALRFDGSNDFVQIANNSSLNVTTGLTAEAWIKTTSTTEGYILDKSEGAYYFAVNADGNVGRLSVYLSGISDLTGGWLHSDSNNVNDDQWHHVAATFDGAYIRLYVDGVFNGSRNAAGHTTITTNSSTLYIGVRNGSGNYFNGTIEEVKLWNTARTISQIRSDMHRTQPGGSSGPVAYYQFSEGSGTATAEPGGNTGTLTNGPTWVASTAPVGFGSSLQSSPMTDGNASLGTFGLTLSSGPAEFDNTTSLVATAIAVAPDSLPGGSATLLDDRYWIVRSYDGDPGSFSGTMFFTVPSTFTNNGIIGSLSNFHLYHRGANDGDNTWTEIATASGVSSDLVEFMNVSVLGQFMIGHNDPLPVEMTSFTAQATRLSAELRWKTATEANNAGFEIERKSIGTPQSAIGNSLWSKIAFVSGTGTANSPNEYSYSDRQLAPGRYAYRIKQIDKGGAFKYSAAVEVEVGSAPTEFTLNQNYPNPFNPSTTIEFTIPADGRATLKVYNMIGQEVATLVNADLKAGVYQRATFDATNLATGLYIARLEAGGKQLLKKMLLVK